MSNNKRDESRRIIPNALTLAFSKASGEGAWWYEVETGRLEYGKKILSHLNPIFHGLNCWGSNKWIRGMVFTREDKHYILVYMEDPVMKDASSPDTYLTNIKNRIADKTGFMISCIVNEEGCRIL